MEKEIVTKSDVIISESFCFHPEKYFSVQLYHKALDKYNENLETALNLEGDHPIFLDTNVLLDFYKLSFSEREELLKFFNVNKSRIWITSKIEEEFLKHRIDHIRNYLKSLDEFVNSYRNIREELDRLKEGTIKGFDHYLENNIILKNDYQDLRNELKALNTSVKDKLVSLFSDEDFEAQFTEKEKKIQEIRIRLEEQANIERQDPLLKIVAEFNITSPLLDEEIDYLQNHFDSLQKGYETIKSDQNINWKHTFPGCGEKKENPYGDFLIYHQMLKFMKENSSDAIFLTNDVQKNDWLLRNKTELIPYTHYITNSYANSGQTLYIFQAKDKIRISYDPVYLDINDNTNKEIEENEITESLESRIEKIGVKIVDKIDLPRNYPLREPQNTYWYDEISEDDFLKELEASQKWAQNYGDGFVGLKSFITKYLGSKGYDYRASYDIKEKLESENKIEVYTHEPINSMYNPVEAVRIKK